MADGGCQGACLERWTNGRIRRRWACIRFATALRELLSRITRNFYTLPTLPMPSFLGRRRPRFVFFLFAANIAASCAECCRGAASFGQVTSSVRPHGEAVAVVLDFASSRLPMSGYASIGGHGRCD
jgi:hypothetical protein